MVIENINIQQFIDPTSGRVRFSRTLDNQDIIESILQDTVSRKMSITTLKEVFDQFVQSCDKSYLNFNFNSYDTTSVIFEYEMKNWKGTITKEFSIYKNKLIKFINIKLPNDGFIYTSKYFDTQKPGKPFLMNEESTQFIQCLEKVMLTSATR